MTYEIRSQLPYAHGGPPLTGVLKTEPEDFEVDEVLGFEADGLGEHDLLLIEKRGGNTHWVAEQLARFAKVSAVAVGFAGLKDRQAVTRQHFSVQLPGRKVDWSTLELNGVRVLGVARHSRKLKRGALTGNRFAIRLREVGGDRDVANHTLALLLARGAPNYFGEQRFGHEGGNLDRASALFSGARMDRQQRGFALSAARSEVFNAVLATRVSEGSWDRLLPGELCMLDGRRAYFGPLESVDADANARCATFDIHPSGPLWGRGVLPTTADCLALETVIVAAFADFAAGLEAAGMDQERRALRIRAVGLEMEWESADELRLRFELPAGAYATAFLRELVVPLAV